MQWIIDHKEVVLAFLLALSEILALIPGIQSNSIFQLIFNSLKKAKDAISPKSDPKV